MSEMLAKIHEELSVWLEICGMALALGFIVGIFLFGVILPLKLLVF